MSIWGYRVTRKLVTIGVLVVGVVVGALAAGVPQQPQREITLVARGMAFYLLGDPTTPNPTIVLNPGERVRIVLRNDDRGMTHDFAVPALRASLDPVDWSEEEHVTFDVPETAGQYEYFCRPHMLMMRGQILVR
jgi:hypothetical protein